MTRTDVAAPPREATVTIVLDGRAADLDARAAVLSQDRPAHRALVRGGAGGGVAFERLGFVRTNGWNDALGQPDALVWLSDGQDAVSSRFSSIATAALRAHRGAAFAAAVTVPAESPRGLIGALSGAALGAATLMRGSALRAIGGIDEGAQSALQAQWDLAIRLAEAGYRWLEVPAMQAGGEETCLRAGSEIARALYRKHHELYERHLHAVLLDGERAAAALLRENDLAQQALEEELRPRLRARRRERDRLGARLRRSGAPRSRARRSPAEPHTRVGEGAQMLADFRRTRPLSPFSGAERGLRIDRWYIERFLADHAEDIRGNVLVSADAADAVRLDGERVERCEVIDIDPADRGSSPLGAMRRAPHIPAGGCDCAILTHGLQLLRDPASAIAQCARMLSPGGVLLASVPAAACIEHHGEHADRWRFSRQGFAELLRAGFGAASIDVRSHGSADAIAAFLVGLCAEELGAERLEHEDPDMPLLITARVVKAPSSAARVAAQS